MTLPTSGIDHQVTYCADVALLRTLETGLQHHQVVTRVLQTTYFDTLEFDLHAAGITLRDRVAVGRQGKLGKRTTEAKIPVAGELRRTVGADAHAAVGCVLGESVVRAERLRPVAYQTKRRRLLLVGGRRLAPDFVVALDDVDAEMGTYRSQRSEIDVQLFSALPWTRTVDDARIARFEEFCRSLETEFGLIRQRESGYHAIVGGAVVEQSAQPNPEREPGVAPISSLRRSLDRFSEVQLLDGLTAGARLRTEALFASSSQLIVDASHVATVAIDGITVVPVAEIFSNPKATFLGFGKPNVFLVVPRSPTSEVEAGWDKFAAFMFWRKAAHIADTKGRVQGGVMVELRNLPPESVVRLRSEMQSSVGKKTITCANATARVLTKSGFTCGGRTLAYKIRPMTLAKAVWDQGLEYEGRPVVLRVVRTHSGTVSEHFVGVLRKEVTSFCRAAQKAIKTKGSSSRKGADSPTLQPRALAPMEAREHEHAGRLELRVGRSSRLAAVLQHHIGEHPIFEARLDPSIADINGATFGELQQVLKAYPGRLGAASKLKRYVLFSRPVVSVVRRQLAAKMDSLGHLPGPTLVDMFQVAPISDPFRYNVVITGTAARMTRLENRTAKDVGGANWLLAKHVLLSGYDPDVRFAGEIWVEDTPTGRLLHLNDNSGTYQPSAVRGEAAARFLEQLTGVPARFQPCNVERLS